jgi:hypothetical protein
LPSALYQVKANRGQTREFTEENRIFGKARFLTEPYVDSDFAGWERTGRGRRKGFWLVNPKAKSLIFRSSAFLFSPLLGQN